jgi:hypothetical protein
MKLFTPIYDDCRLVPHFFAHYHRLGVTTFVIAASPNIVSEILPHTSGFDVIVRHDLDTADSFQGGSAAVTALRAEYSSPDEWVMITDVDEFLDAGTGVQDEIARAEEEGANVVRAQMVDRVAIDGSFPPIDPGTDLWATFPRECALTKLLQWSTDYKGVLVRGHLEAAMAHHEFRDERLASRWLRLHHFKWNANVLPRLQSAIDLARASGINWWVEYDRVLRHVAEHGRIRWEDYPAPERGSAS